MSNHTHHNPASPIRCKRCKAELARSFGAGVIVNAVRNWHRKDERIAAKYGG